MNSSQRRPLIKQHNVLGSSCNITDRSCNDVSSDGFVQSQLAEEIDKLRSELDQFRLRAGSLTEPTLSRYVGWAYVGTDVCDLGNLLDSNTTGLTTTDMSLRVAFLWRNYSLYTFVRNLAITELSVSIVGYFVDSLSCSMKV